MEVGKGTKFCSAQTELRFCTLFFLKRVPLITLSHFIPTTSLRRNYYPCLTSEDIKADKLSPLQQGQRIRVLGKWEFRRKYELFVKGPKDDLSVRSLRYISFS